MFKHVSAGLILCVLLSGCAPPPRMLTAADPGVATEGRSLLIALPLVNSSGQRLSDVLISAIALEDKRIFRPAQLPLSVTDLPSGATVVLQLAFDAQALEADRDYTLRLEGTASFSGESQTFLIERGVSLPLPDQGEYGVRHVTVEARPVDGGDFDLGPNAARSEGLNEFPPPPIPKGLHPVTFEPNSAPTAVRHLSLGNGETRDHGSRNANETIVFPRASKRVVQECCVLEPSGGSVDLPSIPGKAAVRMVFLSGNTYLLLSADGGANYSKIDPKTVFPPIPLDGLPQDTGICCDQNLIYIPSIDRFVWQLLTHGSQIALKTDENGEPELDETGKPIPLNGMNRLRVAMASPEQIISSGGKSWSYWDMTTATFGLPDTTFLDYPSLSFSRDYLHVGVTAKNRLGKEDWEEGFFVAAIPLVDVQNGGVIHIGHTHPKFGQISGGARLAHDCPDAAYWFGHIGDGSNQMLRVFEWPDAAPNFSWRTLKIEPWKRFWDPEDKNLEFQSKTPDGTNWLTANIDSVRGAACIPITDDDSDADRALIMAWNAGRGGGFPQPYVRLQRVLRTPTKWLAPEGAEIWHPDFAFHHAHLATNANGEVGISVAAGGGTGGDATPVTGFVGDSTLYKIGVSTASIDRWGDYTAIRPHWPNDKLFSVADYYLVAPNQTKIGIHQHRLFGREADVGGTF